LAERDRGRLAEGDLAGGGHEVACAVGEELGGGEGAGTGVGEVQEVVRGVVVVPEGGLLRERAQQRPPVQPGVRHVPVREREGEGEHGARGGVRRRGGGVGVMRGRGEGRGGGSPAQRREDRGMGGDGKGEGRQPESPRGEIGQTLSTESQSTTSKIHNNYILT